MLTTKAESRGLKLLLPAFGFLIIIFYSFFPFFLPEWYAEDYKKLKTNRDSHGICRQSTDYTCGPAAAVTALGELNISSEEGELAVLSFTNWVTGTPTDQLCNALNSRLAPHKLKCKTLQITDISGIKQFPAIATIEYGFLVDHYVTILGWKGDRLIIADPIGGLKLMKKDEFQEKWRKTVIVFERKL
ncbi:MAG: cysteine peptidase family C39 domain-containing protein [Candidatus Rifleibacteriota bacterium]